MELASDRILTDSVLAGIAAASALVAAAALAFGAPRACHAEREPSGRWRFLRFRADRPATGLPARP